jgi:hypothetical protein
MIFKMNFGSADGPSFSLVCCALLFSLCPMSLSLAPQTGEVTYVTSNMQHWRGVLSHALQPFLASTHVDLVV